MRTSLNPCPEMTVSCGCALSGRQAVFQAVGTDRPSPIAVPRPARSCPGSRRPQRWLLLSAGLRLVNSRCRPSACQTQELIRVPRKGSNEGAKKECVRQEGRGPPALSGSQRRKEGNTEVALHALNRLAISGGKALEKETIDAGGGGWGAPTGCRPRPLPVQRHCRPQL